MLPRWGAVIAASTAHINVDEGGAPERVAGIKLLTVPTDDGKLTPELIDREAWGWGDEHRAQPLVVSVTQSTELGTVYSVDELRAIADHTHSPGMSLHMDGARVSNAAASLGLPLRAFTRDIGVDVLSFGGTKNGAMLGEAIVVLDPEASAGLTFLRKLNMQLSSKMRFVSAQLIALLEGDLWLRNASHSNAMAARLRAGVEAGLAGRLDPGRRIQPADAGERRVRDAPGRRGRSAARILPLLRLGCREERGALDVQLRHHRGRHRRVHRRDRAGDGAPGAGAGSRRRVGARPGRVAGSDGALRSSVTRARPRPACRVHG